MALLLGTSGFRSATGNGGKTTTPVAAFTGTPLTGLSPLSVTFTDASTNTPVSWLWEKNDGSGWVPFAGTPTAQNPTESFAVGSWSVRLTATNAGGTNTKTRTDYVAASALIAHAVGPGGQNGATTPGINTTGANLFVAAVGGFAAVPTMTDSKGNIWTKLTTEANADGFTKATLFWSSPTSTGAGNTFTCGGAASYSNVAVAALYIPGPAFDQQGGASAGTYPGAGVLTAQPGSLTPAADNSLVVVGWCQIPADDSAGGQASGINGGFTLLDVAGYLSSNYFGVGLGYLIQTAKAAANPTVTYPVPCSVAMAAAVFKPTA